MRRLILAIVFAIVPSVSLAQGQWIADPRTGCKVWNGIPEPKARIQWSGPCAHGFATGKGVLQWFLDSKPTGRHEGDFRDGKAHGRGVYTWRNGDRYEGERSDDKQHGRGVYTFANGNRYKGEWRDGKRDGRGVYTWRNGDRFEGDFRDGKQHGRGVYTFANGNRYEGDFRDGKPHGFGAFIAAGETYSGQWSKGCFRQGNRTLNLGATKAECGFGA